MAAASAKILRIEDILSSKSADSATQEIKKVKKLKKEKTAEVVKGLPKSGRFWKSERQRFTSIIKTKGIRKSNKFEKLQKKREDLKRVKQLTKSIVEERNRKIEEKKQRRRDNMKRQAENQKKSEIVQVIKNSAKIKRMRKKQLRSIEKRDTLVK